MRKLWGVFKSLITVLIIFVICFGVAIFYLFPTEYSLYVTTAAVEHGVNEPLIFAIIKAESGFNEKAVSHKNAKGLMQITDETAEFISGKLGILKYDIYDPEININFGTYYIKYLLDLYNGDERMALYAYNAGMGNVSKWIKEADGNYSATISQFGETTNYYKKVMWYKGIYEKLHR